jgi:hypothetical protein
MQHGARPPDLEQLRQLERRESCFHGLTASLGYGNRKKITLPSRKPGDTHRVRLEQVSRHVLYEYLVR